MQGRPLFWKNKCFQVGFEGVQRGFLSERKGKDIPCREAEEDKSSGTESGKSGTRNLEVENESETMNEKLSGEQSTGGCVKLKTVTEI